MRVLILGGDGFCGWPTALHLSARDNEVHIVDNFARRRIDRELGCGSLTPISELALRIKAWHEISRREISFHELDVAQNYGDLLGLIRDVSPDVVVHFAEQRSAPYSMKSSWHKQYTVNNNVNATNNILCAIVDSGRDIHLVHLGTMGVYGYNSLGIKLAEGYLDVDVPTEAGIKRWSIPFPTNPGSIYHMTKVQDAVLFQFFSKNNELRITDLHQGVVWGTHTAETSLDERLINRFDYDGDFGTVLNRFIVQAARNHPLTVYGGGGQTRAFIHIRDSVRCIELAIANPPAKGARVEVYNQATEAHRVKDLAALVSRLSGTPINSLKNPRVEPDVNDLLIENAKFRSLGLTPTLLNDGVVHEIAQIASRYIDRCDVSKIPPTSTWR
jgi:UDP-sulfoquinovose synthase